MIRFADPDSASRIVDVDSLRMIALPFRPPAADIRDLRGRLVIGADTIGFDAVEIELPSSTLRLDGNYAFGGHAGVALRIRGAPLSLPDLRFLRPSLPSGGGEADFTIGRTADATRLTARHLDLEVEGATLAGSADVETGPTGIKVRRSDLAFAELDTKVVERLVPELRLPVDGVLGGRLKASGEADDLVVDGSADVRERSGAISRVTAQGRVLDGPEGFVADQLRLRFSPLRLTLLRQAGAELPVGGWLTGSATLDGPLAGLLTVDADLAHDDPASGRSHLRARGGVRVTGGLEARRLALTFDPLQSRLVKLAMPSFALGGTLRGRATLTGTPSRLALDADVIHEQAGMGRSRVLAVGAVQTGGGLFARGLRLRFDPLQGDVVRALAPSLPLTGAVIGRVTLSGPLQGRFTVDADLTHAEAGTGTSHLLAVGDMRVQGGFEASGLRLRMDPLQIALVRVLQPTFKPDGVLTGTITLNGVPTLGITAALAVTHAGSTGTSTLTGDATLTVDRDLRAFDLALNASPLALATFGLYAPAAGLRGSVSGPIAARGTPAAATIRAALDVAGVGRIMASGRVGLGPTAEYDLRADVAAFDAGSVSSRLPTTALTGALAARGIGTDPATARAVVEASLVDSRVEGTPTVDSTRLQTRIADGLVTFDVAELRLATGSADLEGSFGLVAGRSGELRYRVRADSLAQFRGYAVASSEVVVPRPMPRLRALGRARADSARAADQAVVAAVATGRRTGAAPTLDTLPTLRRDSISGSIDAEGTLVGNLTEFDARGTATLDRFVWNGTALGTGKIEYAVLDAPTSRLSVELDAELADVRAAGFAFDSTSAVVLHQGARREGSGHMELAVFQDQSRDYRLTTDYTLALDRQEVLLNEMVMRFDSTVWSSTRPGAVRWAGSGVELDDIDLTSDRGGHIFADGRLPTEGSGDLRLDIDSLQIADLAALLQDTLDTRGLLSIEGTFRGTTGAPIIAGTIALDSASSGGRSIPALRGTFDYADARFTTHVEAVEGARVLLIADGVLPLDLAFTGVTGPRFRDGPVSLDIEVDSFPLQSLPQLNAHVEDLAGRVRGEVTVRGTRAEPELGGYLTLVGGSALLPEGGLHLTDAAGSFRLSGDELLVDSLVARSGPGRVEVEGKVLLASLTEPELDLSVTATDALLIANELGEVEGDAFLVLGGTFEAMRVTGELNIEQGVIEIPEPQSSQRATRLDDPQLAGVYEGLGVPLAMRPSNFLLDHTDLDVRVRIARDIWLRNTVMNVEVYTPEEADPLRISVDRVAHRFMLEGVINADRGDYSFAGREFKLTTGSVTFLAEAPDPMLQLSARHEVPRRTREALVILVSVGGTLAQPKVSLSSNVEPKIPESDLLSYLAFGRESSSLRTREGSGVVGDALGGLGVLAEQQLAGLGLSAVTQAFVSNLESEGMEAGLDVFRVRPRAVPDELNFTSYFQNLLRTIDIEAGEYIGSRLFVAARGAVNGGVPGLRAEYITPRGFSWITSWESRFFAPVPTLDELTAQRVRVLGSFITWQRRF